MKIEMTIPISTDGPLDEEMQKEIEEFKKALINHAVKTAAEQFAPGARMFGTLCRFSFEKPTVKISQ